MEKNITNITSFKGVKSYNEVNSIESLSFGFERKIAMVKDLPGQKYIEHIYIVPLSEIKQAPLRNNLRAAKITRAVKDMWKTLLTEKEKFYDNNMGIYYNTTKVEENMETNQLKVYFNGEETGCMNGNHTTCLSITAQEEGLDLKGAFVRLHVREYLEGMNKEELTKIAVGLNTGEVQLDYAEGELIGAHEVLKEAMGKYKDSYEWVPGERSTDNKELKKTPYNVVALLGLMDIFKYPKTNIGTASGHPTGTVLGKAAPYRKWLKAVKENKPTTIEKLYPMLKELIEFEDEVITNFHSYGSLYFIKGKGVAKEVAQKTLIEDLGLSLNKKGSYTSISGRVPKYTPEVQVLSPIISAYRANIEYNQETGEIGWIVDPYKLMKRVNNDLVKTVADVSKTHKSDAGRTKNNLCRPQNKGMWDNLYNQVSMAVNSMLLEEMKVS